MSKDGTRCKNVVLGLRAFEAIAAVDNLLLKEKSRKRLRSLGNDAQLTQEQRRASVLRAYTLPGSGNDESADSKDRNRLLHNVGFYDNSADVMSQSRIHGGRTQAEQVLAQLAKTPLLRARDLTAMGIARETLRRLLASGELEQPSRGLYARRGADLSVDVSLAEVARRTPHAVIGLVSALRFHGLTTQLPHEVWIYIDRKARVPMHPPVRLRIFRVSGDGLTDGVQPQVIDGVPVRITGVSRTLVDCFKRRNDVGLDVALEALRDAHRQKKLNLKEVWRIAERRRALTFMRPYLEAVA